jgi:hypothetical protein
MPLRQWPIWLCRTARIYSLPPSCTLILWRCGLGLRRPPFGDPPPKAARLPGANPLALRGLRARPVSGRRLPPHAGTLPAPIALRVPSVVAVALALAIAPPAITPPALVVQPILAAIAEIAAQTHRLGFELDHALAPDRVVDSELGVLKQKRFVLVALGLRDRCGRHLTLVRRLYDGRGGVRVQFDILRHVSIQRPLRGDKKIPIS